MKPYTASVPFTLFVFSTPSRCTEVLLDEGNSVIHFALGDFYAIYFGGDFLAHRCKCGEDCIVFLTLLLLDRSFARSLGCMHFEINIVVVS